MSNMFKNLKDKVATKVRALENPFASPEQQAADDTAATATATAATATTTAAPATATTTAAPATPERPKKLTTETATREELILFIRKQAAQLKSAKAQIAEAKAGAGAGAGAGAEAVAALEAELAEERAAHEASVTSLQAAVASAQRKATLLERKGAEAAAGAEGLESEASAAFDRVEELEEELRQAQEAGRASAERARIAERDAAAAAAARARADDAESALALLNDKLASLSEQLGEANATNTRLTSRVRRLEVANEELRMAAAGADEPDKDASDGGASSEPTAAGASIDATLKVIRMGELIKEKDAALEASAAQTAELEEAAASLRTQLEAAGAALETARADAADAAAAASQARAELETQLEHAQIALEDSDAEHAGVVADLNKIRALAEEKLGRATAEATKLRAALSTAKAENLDLADTVTELRSKAALSGDAAADAAAAKKQVAKLLAAVAESEAQASAAKTQATQATARADAAEARVAALESETASATASSAELEVVRAELDAARAEYEDYKSRAAKALADTGDGSLSRDGTSTGAALAASAASDVPPRVAAELVELKAALATAEARADALPETRDSLDEALATIETLRDRIEALEQAAADSAAAAAIKLDAVARDSAAQLAESRKATETALAAASASSTAEINRLRAALERTTEDNDTLILQVERLKRDVARLSPVGGSSDGDGGGGGGGDGRAGDGARVTASYASQIAELRTKLRESNKSLRSKQKTIDALRREAALGGAPGSPSGAFSGASVSSSGLGPGASGEPGLTGGMSPTQVAYLANVVLEYVKTHDDKGLLPVLAKLLSFTEPQLAAVRKARSWTLW